MNVADVGCDSHTDIEDLQTHTSNGGHGPPYMAGDGVLGSPGEESWSPGSPGDTICNYC